MTARAPLSLADWVVALHELAPRGVALDEVQRMLQLEASVELAASRVGGAHKAIADLPSPPADFVRPSAPERPTAAAPTLASALTEDVRTIAAARPARDATPIVPDRVANAIPLDLSGDADTSPPLEPLFAARQGRAIVAAAVATRRYDGDVDVQRVLRDLTRLRPLQRVPRLPRASLQLGCQILADYSEAMEPYATDRRALVHALQVTVGKPRVTVHAFRGAPLDAERSGEPPWRPPPRGTPIVVISDLGIGGPPFDPDRTTRHDWIAVAQQARRARCPIVAFVPFGPRRWDAALTRLIMHVHWDRPTSAGIVRRAVGPGHPTA